MSTKIGILCAIILLTTVVDTSDAAAESSVQHVGDAISTAALAMHDMCVKHPLENSVACVRKNHTMVEVCDGDPDGHHVRAHVLTCSGQFIALTDWQPQLNSCDHYWVADICYVRVCVEDEGCSAWRSV